MISIMEFFLSRWDLLSAFAQDVSLLVVIVLPVLVLATVLVFGYGPAPLVSSLLRRYFWTNVVFVLVIGVSVGLGVGLLAQERALRVGSAESASKFDLIVTTPGSEVDRLLNTVYLQPGSAPLLPSTVLDELTHHKAVDFAAPVVLGDVVAGEPMVGTISALVQHLSAELAEGQHFESTFDAVIGARSALRVGEHFNAEHDGVLVHAHQQFTVTGRLQPTGSPWDKAVLIPIEAVWQLHGLGNGHEPGSTNQLGPPFDAKNHPGVSSIVVRATSLAGNYGLRSEFSRNDTMAFFPGAVLTRLHKVLGDVRQVMSIMASVTQILVALSVLAALILVTRLFARQLAMLRAVGAPSRFVLCVLWCYCAGLVLLGTVVGLVMAIALTGQVSTYISQQTNILVQASIGWPEWHSAALFLSSVSLLALFPALLAMTRPVVSELR